MLAAQISEALAVCGLRQACVRADNEPSRFSGGYKRHALEFALTRNQARFLNDTLSEWLRLYSYPRVAQARALFDRLHQRFFGALYVPLDLDTDEIADPIVANEWPGVPGDKVVARVRVDLTPGDALLVAQWITLRYAVDSAPPSWYVQQEGISPEVGLLLRLSRQLLDIVGFAPLEEERTQTACRIDLTQDTRRAPRPVECEALSFNGSIARDQANQAMHVLQSLSPDGPGGDMAGSYTLSYLVSHHARAWTKQMEKLLDAGGGPQLL